MENIIDKDKNEAIELYRQGAEEWKKGNRSKAISLYNRSLELYADSPAKTALKMATDIMAFYDKDRYNP